MGSSFRDFRLTTAPMIAHPGVLDAKPSNLKTLSLSDGREKVIAVVFFSRQRGDFVDFRCLGAQETRFEAKFGAHRPEPKLSFSRCPGSPWARPGLFQSSPGCSGLLGCSWLLPAPPNTEPQAHPEHDTQHGQLRQTLALHSEFSKQPGVHHWTRPT